MLHGADLLESFRFNICIEPARLRLMEIWEFKVSSLGRNTRICSIGLDQSQLLQDAYYYSTDSRQQNKRRRYLYAHK
jgi:hypothetical protein